MSPTAAALIIGNEILTGKVQEINVRLLAKELFSLGVELRRIVVCQDDIDTIAADLDQLRATHDWVITSGGVGPTHDDVTLKAVAQCFRRKIVRSESLSEKIRELVGDRVNEGHLRMADVPEEAELLVSDEVPWPTVLVENVFVMPGLPRVFELKLPVLRDRIGAHAPLLSRAVYTLCRETELAQLLDRLVDEHREVSIGSYPVLDEDYRVRVTFDGRDRGSIDRAVDAFVADLPADRIVAVDRVEPLR